MRVNDFTSEASQYVKVDATYNSGGFPGLSKQRIGTRNQTESSPFHVDLDRALHRRSQILAMLEAILYEQWLYLDNMTRRRPCTYSKPLVTVLQK